MDHLHSFENNEFIASYNFTYQINLNPEINQENNQENNQGNNQDNNKENNQDSNVEIIQSIQISNIQYNQNIIQESTNNNHIIHSIQVQPNDRSNIKSNPISQTPALKNNMIILVEKSNIRKYNNHLERIPEDVLRYNILPFLDENSMVNLYRLSFHFRSIFQKQQNTLPSMKNFFDEEDKILMESYSLQVMFPRPFSKKITYNNKTCLEDLPQSYCSSKEYYDETRDNILVRAILCDCSKFIILIEFTILLNCSIFVFIIWGYLTSIFSSIFYQTWMLYVLLGLFFIVTILFINFTFMYIIMYDYVPFYLKCLRKIAFFEKKAPIHYIGVVQDYKRRNWNVAVVEFLLHLLWIPLTVLLYSIKLISSKYSKTWTYWTLPAYVIWGIYIVTTFSNIIFDIIEMKQMKSKFSAKNLCLSIWRFSYFCTVLIFILPFYTLLLTGSLLLIGKVDGWLNVPWTLSLSFILLSILVLSIFLIFFPCLNICHQIIPFDRKTPKSLPKKWKYFQALSDSLFSIYQISYEIQIIFWINQLWPIVVTFILSGLKLDQIINIHWVWVFSPMTIWFTVLCIISYCVCCVCIPFSFPSCLNFISRIIQAILSPRNR